MKKILGLLFVIIVTAFATSAAFAGDWAEMRFFGFSEDGKYLAFEEYGEWDVHGGGDYANTYFIDVDKNAYAIAPVAYSYSDNDEKTTGEYSQEAQKARYKAAVAAGMKRFHIVAGNTGKLVAAHMTSDHSFDKPQNKIGEYYTKDGRWIKKSVPAYDGYPYLTGYDPARIIFRPTYYPVNPNPEDFFELKLRQFSSKKPCVVRGVSSDSLMLEITLKDNTHHTNLPLQVLQKDKFLPEARNCPDHYEMEQVYFYKDKLAVFIEVYTMGFPGSTLRYMTVTGALETKSEE